MRRPVVLATVAALLCTAALRGREAAQGAPGASPSPAAALRVAALDLTYNLDHAAALDVYEAAIAADPTHPAAWRLMAATIWIMLLLEQGAITSEDYLGQATSEVARRTPSPALQRKFNESLERGQTLADLRVRARPGEADAHYQAGAAAAYRATYTATVEGRVTGAFGAARRAYDEHERVLDLDPTRHDAGLVVGLYRYTVASQPFLVRLFARLAGFGSGRERGIQMVEAAAAYPSEVQANALFTLIVLYNREARHDDALRVIRELQRRYPRNRLLWLEEGLTALRAERFDEARVALTHGMGMLPADPRPRAWGESARWHLALGAALVALDERAPAGRALDVALGSEAPGWVYGRARLERGRLADLEGDRAAALTNYRLAETLCRRDADEECSRRARELQRRPYRTAKR